MPMRLWVACFLLAALLSPATASGSGKGRAKPVQTVFAEGGNIFLKIESKVVQLTQTGMDGEPILSPDGRWVVFTREIEGKAEKCAKDKDRWSCATELLCSIDLATQTEQVIVEPAEDMPDPSQEIAGFAGITFSPDGKTVYFETPAWAVSGAIHAVDPDGKNERFIAAGDDLKVIKRSKDEKLTGLLIMHKHEYYLGLGSYDWYWAATPEGKTLGPLGEDLEPFTEALAVEYMGSSSPFSY